MAKRTETRNPRTAAENPGQAHASVPFWAGLIATVFVANGAIMALEIVAGPLSARYLGSSLYTWTTIIGVILGGMAAGNYLGGRLADRCRPAPLLGTLFLLAALGCVLIPVFNHLFGTLPFLRGWPWPARIFTHLLCALTGPALLLGTVNPVAARLALGRGKPDGRAVGLVYASAAAGSILGTFAAGYYLVMVLGLSHIVYTVAGVLALLGLAWLARGRAAAPADTPNGPAPEPAADAASLPWGVWVAPNATVFLSNAAFMTVELTASRLATRTLGHSLHTWTALLGIVLAGITVGNYLGGRLADRFTPHRLLAFLFPLAAVVCLTVPALNAQVAFGPMLLGLSWTARTFWHITLAFFLPCAVLGTIGPAAAKFALETRRARGNALGNVYAWGALGSVVGTFLTGYVLIDRLWPITTLCALALTLALAGSLYSRRNYVNHLVTAGCAVALLLAVAPVGPLDTLARGLGLREASVPGLVYEDHSQYAWIGVTESPDQLTGHRTMVLDSLNHSEVILGQPDQLLFFFWWVYDAVIDHHFPGKGPLKSLTIGGGGYVFPHYLERSRPGSEVQVAEIDPAVTRAARQAFGLPDDSAIQVYNMDGRNHVEDLVRRRADQPDTPPFDLIIGDSINQFSVPFQLTTREFTQSVHDLLGDDGLYLLNTTDRLDSGLFLGAVIHTCRQVFPFVRAFSCRPRDIDRHDSFVVVCAKRPLDLAPLPGLIRSRYPFYTGDLLAEEETGTLVARAGKRVLTDNHAPVDNLVSTLEDSQKTSAYEAKENYARSLYVQAERDAAARNYTEAQPRYEELVGLFPDNPQLWTALGINVTRLGRASEAVRHLNQALACAPQFAPARNALGAVLVGAGRGEEALTQFDEAVRCRPGYADALANRARLLGTMGRFDAAVDAFNEAIAANPKDAALHYGLAQALRKGARFEEAAGALERALDLRPAFWQARMLLGQVHAQRGAFTEAVAPLEAVLKEQPGHALGHFVLAGVYYSLDRKEEALTHYREAFRLDPENEDAGYNTGVILNELGRPKEAMAVLEPIVTANPLNERARIELDRARSLAVMETGTP